MRLIETAVALGLWAMLVLAAGRTTAAQELWGEAWESAEAGQTEMEWEKEQTEDRSESEPRVVTVTELTLPEGETEKIYDGTTAVQLQAQVQGLPDGMELTIAGESLQADVGTWPVTVTAALEGEGSENYTIVLPTELPEVTILPRPLKLSISDARKNYGTENAMENLVFSCEEPVTVTGFLTDKVPDGFALPELVIDETVLRQDSPMYEKGEEIVYSHAVTVKYQADGQMTGNPTANYCFEVEGGDVTLSPMEITDTVDYTVQCQDSSRSCIRDGELWIRAGEPIVITPTGTGGFTEGKVITDTADSGTVEFALIKRNENGEIIAQSQIRSVSWLVDGSAPQAVLTLGGSRLAEEECLIGEEMQVKVEALTETGSGVKSVQIHVETDHAGSTDGAALYEQSKETWSEAASAPVREEGLSRVWIRLEDLVGNVRYQCSGLISLDRTKPQLLFEGVTPGSANRGDVSISCTFLDEHLSASDTKVTLTGYHTGEREADWRVQQMDGGLRLELADIPKEQGWDDLYTLRMEATDLAGNASSAEIRFSVNRFGSVYYLSEQTQKALSSYYLKEPVPLEIREINVDYLTESELILGYEGQTRKLKKGTDYTVERSGTDETWKEYRYQIPASLCSGDGLYYLVCASRDRAQNSSDSRQKRQKIEFAVDTGSPQILISGIRDGESYQGEGLTAEIECLDNLALQEVTVTLNGETVLQNDQERQTIDLQVAKEWQRLCVTATDKAGNTGTEEVYFWLGELQESETVPTLIRGEETRIPQQTAAEEGGEAKKQARGLSGSAAEQSREEKGREFQIPVWAALPVIGVFIGICVIFLRAKREKE